MLGIRQLYPSSAVHVACILPLDDDLSRTSPSVLLAGVGFSVDVYRIETHPLSSEPAAMSDHGRDDYSVVSFTPTGHRINLGNMVIRIAALRHQLAIFLTKELELIIVRYQANLPHSSNEKGSAYDPCVSKQNHWCILYRHSSFTTPIGSQTLKTLAKPVSDPKLIVDENGKTAQAIIFTNIVHSIYIEYPKPKMSMTENSLALFGLIHRTKFSKFYDCAWPAEAPLSCTGFHFRTQTKSESTYVHAESEAMRPQGLNEGWLQGSPSVADEDLMLEHSISVLAKKKHELSKMMPNSPVRDPQLPTVYIDMEFAEAKSLACLSSAITDTMSCFAQVLSHSLTVNIVCVNFDSSPPGRLLVNHLAHLRVQSNDLEKPYTPYYVITTTLGSLEKPETCVYALSSDPTGQYIHHWRVNIFKKKELNFPQKGVRLTTSSEQAAGGVFLCLNNSFSLLLLLQDGSLTEITHTTLQALQCGTTQEQFMSPSFFLPEHGQFNDCLDGAWIRWNITGLPRGFVARDMQPCSFSNPCDLNPFRVATERYILLMDHTYDAFVVDLHKRCVVGGLIGKGSVTSVCRGPRDSILISHSKGTLTQLLPVHPVMIKSTHTLLSRETVNCINPKVRKGSLLLKSAVQELHPIWRVVSIGDTYKELWGILVCDAESTCLLLCDYKDQSGVPMLTEQPKGELAYWLDDEPTLYATALSYDRAKDNFVLVQCTSRRLLVGSETTPFPTQAARAAGCQTKRTTYGLFKMTILVVVILTDSLMIFSCSCAWNLDTSSPKATLLYQQRHFWSCPTTSVTIDAVQENEVVVLIGMWDACIDLLHFKMTGGEDLWAPREVFHLEPPPSSRSVHHHGVFIEPSVPRNIVRVCSTKEACVEWIVQHDDEQLTAVCYNIHNMDKRTARAEWKSLAILMPSIASVRGTGLYHVLKNSEDHSGFDLMLLHDEEIILLATEKEEGKNHGLSALVRSVATAGVTPIDSSQHEWQSGFAVQTRSSVTGLLQHTLFLTDGFQIVIALLSQMDRQNCRESIIKDLENPQGWGTLCDRNTKEHLALASPIIYHTKCSVRVTSDPFQRLLKTLYLPTLGMLLGILDCGEAQSSILVAMSETSLKVCDFLETPNQVVICAAQVSAPSLQDALPSHTTEDIILVGTGAVGVTENDGRVLILLMQPLRIVHTKFVNGNTVVDISVCRQAICRGRGLPHCYEKDIESDILVAVCSGPLVCMYKLVDYVLYPLTSHHLGTDCTSVLLCQQFLSVSLFGLGNVYLQLVYSEDAPKSPNSNPVLVQTSSRLHGDTLSDTNPMLGVDDYESEESIAETQSASPEEEQRIGINNDRSLSALLSVFETLKLKVIAREPTLGSSVFKQDAYRNCPVRVDEDGGVYVSYFSLLNKNDEHYSPQLSEAGVCQPVLTHCCGLPSPASVVKVEELWSPRAVDEHPLRRLHWCEHSAVLLPVTNDCVSIFFGCLDGSLFGAVELPYVFALPLLRMEQIITDYYSEFESVSVCSNIAQACYSAAIKRNSSSLYSRSYTQSHDVHSANRGANIQYVHESVPFSRSCALNPKTQILIKKGVIWLDAVNEYFTLENIVEGSTIPFEDLIPDAIERSRLEHRYKKMCKVLRNAMQEEYKNELSLKDCELILNTW